MDACRSQISRNFVVAVKYGYFPKSDYSVMCKGTFREAEAVNTRHMLIVGWLKPSDKLLENELVESAARNRIDLEQHYFVLSRYRCLSFFYVVHVAG